MALSKNDSISTKMKILSVRKNPEYQEKAIRFIQTSWPNVSPKIYEDCISNCIHSEQSLPQWYLLEKDGSIIGCAGLIPNDFISRMDLYPWLCALYIDPGYRGNNYAQLLMQRAQQDALKFGFKELYLCTDHVGYYEKFDFTYIGQGYHPWKEESRIYKLKLE